MIAIAESGSTKTEWVILNQNGEKVSQFKTQGFNPDFHSSDFIFTTLNQSYDLFSIKEKINQVYFYGASCSSESLNKIVTNGLQPVFPNARVEIDHDLKAAAYSLYDGEPLISCILGTGSNSAYFDGENIQEEVPALGFIIGDEAGGGYFGKRIIAEYFYNNLPKKIHDDFSKTFQLSWDDARKKIYGNIHANVYLASFMPFVAKHREDPFIEEIIREGIAKFIKVHVSCFKKYGKCKVGFVGSIASIFQNIIAEELFKQGFEYGKIIKSPIEELVEYHKKYKNLIPNNSLQISDQDIKKAV